MGSLPFKPEGGKQALLLMHPWGGGLCPTRAAGMLGHEDEISCLQKKIMSLRFCRAGSVKLKSVHQRIFSQSLGSYTKRCDYK